LGDFIILKKSPLTFKCRPIGKNQHNLATLTMKKDKRKISVYVWAIFTVAIIKNRRRPLNISVYVWAIFTVAIVWANLFFKNRRRPLNVAQLAKNSLI
jgi:uncharacterized protein YhhL (DUF1145 family)